MRGFESLCINLDNSVETRRTSCRHLWFSDLGSGIKIVLLSLAKYSCTQGGRSWFVAIYAFFGRLWAEKCSFGSKTAFLGQKVAYYMVQICVWQKLLWSFLRSPNGCQLLPLWLYLFVQKLKKKVSHPTEVWQELNLFSFWDVKNGCWVLGGKMWNERSLHII